MNKKGVKSLTKNLILSVFLLLGMFFLCNSVLLAEDYKPFEKSPYNVEATSIFGNHWQNNLIIFSPPQPQLLYLDGVDDGDALGIIEVPISDGFLILVGLSIIFLVIKKNTQNLNKQ